MPTVHQSVWLGSLLNRESLLKPQFPLDILESLSCHCLNQALSYNWFRICVESVYRTLQVTRVRREQFPSILPEPKAQSVPAADVTLG